MDVDVTFLGFLTKCLQNQSDRSKRDVDIFQG